MVPRARSNQGRIMSVLRTARQQGADAISLSVNHARTPNRGGLIPPLNYPNTLQLGL